MNSVFTPKLDGVVKDKGSVSLLWLFPKMFFWEGAALLPLLQLSGITGDPGARGVRMESPGWGEWLGNGGIFLKRFQCPVLRRMLGCCAGILRHSTAFPWMASPIHSHVPQLFLLGVPTSLGGSDIWEHKSRDKLTLQPSSLICSHGGSSGRWIVQGQIPDGKFGGAHSGLLLSTPSRKKIFWCYHARAVLSLWFIFWKCGCSPSKMWAQSLQKSTTRGAGSYVHFTARCLNTRQNLDLNCLFWGMWPEECLGLPLGFSDFTQSYLPPAPPPAAAHPRL